MLYPETEHLRNPTCLPSGRNKVNAESQWNPKWQGIGKD
jgi:hypothetical protein